MIKENKGKIILSSAIVLFPMIIGLILWNALPEQMVTHWGVDGAADGWSSKYFSIFGIPLLMLAVHLLCIFFCLRDPKNAGQSGKVLGMIFWVCPIISVGVNITQYSIALGMDIGIQLLMPVILGLMFIITGNYLPKCKRNSTIGIKVEWALNDDENWNHTHRFAGKVWIVGGFLLIILEFLAGSLARIIFPIALLVIAVSPMIYSYLFYRQQLKAGLTLKKRRKNPFWQSVGTLFGVTILGVIMLMLSTGDINISYNETTFLVDASYWDSLEIPYADVDAIEYRESLAAGSRVWGWGSMRLALGTFENDEFGVYTRYSYVGNDACVVLTVDDKILTVGGVDAESTKAIYEELSKRITE